ncbi:hypothetical protein [Georgenia sp. AZ-5]|uniref:hypothetical protein n=1 Tax=Georgenia sp. AZ-5 TaxID=3367526 RepID=UPI0037540425
MTNPPPSAPSGPGRVPVPLGAALLGVLLEVAALAAMAVAFLVDVVRGVPLDLASTVAMTVFFVGVAVVLGAAARALWRGRRWGRGPVVTWQILQLLSGVALGGALPAYLVVALAVLAVGVVVGVLWPSSREHASMAGPPSALA